MNSLQKDGHSVQLLLTHNFLVKRNNKNTATKKNQKTSSTTIRDLKLLVFDLFVCTARLLNEVKKLNPDLIYERENHLQLSGLLVKVFKRKIRLLEVNAPVLEQKQILQGKSYFDCLTKVISHLNYRYSDKLFVISNALGKKIDFSKTKFISAPMAINLIELESNKNNPETGINFPLINKIKHLGMNSKILLYIGSVFPWSGVELLVDYMKKAKPVSTHLLIIGRGVHLESMRDDISSQENILLLDWQTKSTILQIFNLVDLCVIPGFNQYAAPTRVLEFLRDNINFITIQTDPILEVLGDIKDLICFKSLSEMNEKIDFILGNNIKYPQSEAYQLLRNSILQRHTWEVRTKDIEEVFRGLRGF